MRCEWDEKKEAANIAKHGVDFTEARSGIRAVSFAVDEAHSEKEPRLFCIGRITRGIATVRFTHRADRIRIIGAGYWRKGKELYEKNEWLNTRMIKARSTAICGIKDELPSLDQLAGTAGRQTKITLALDDDAIAFFKREARKRMLRNLIRSSARARS